MSSSAPSTNLTNHIQNGHALIRILSTSFKLSKGAVDAVASSYFKSLRTPNACAYKHLLYFMLHDSYGDGYSRFNYSIRSTNCGLQPTSNSNQLVQLLKFANDVTVSVAPFISSESGQQDGCPKVQDPKLNERENKTRNSGEERGSTTSKSSKKRAAYIRKAIRSHQQLESEQGSSSKSCVDLCTFKTSESNVVSCYHCNIGFFQSSRCTYCRKRSVAPTVEPVEHLASINKQHKLGLSRKLMRERLELISDGDSDSICSSTISEDGNKHQLETDVKQRNICTLNSDKSSCKIVVNSQGLTAVQVSSGDQNVIPGSTTEISTKSNKKKKGKRSLALSETSKNEGSVVQPTSKKKHAKQSIPSAFKK